MGFHLLRVMMSYMGDFFSTPARRLRRWPHFANALIAALCAGCAALWWTSCPTASAAPTRGPSMTAPAPATLDVLLGHPLARFSPLQALGGALDGHGEGETPPIYTPANLAAMSRAGLGEIAYRLRTELGVQAWHYDPSGRWSEPDRAQGYWTGTSSPPKRAPAVSWGYELPRRGDTTDQAEDSGYSRIDDGNAQSFWKSDPYLGSRFTHEPDALHPQWVLIDLGHPHPLDALRIAWGDPYATRFRVQRYVGGPDAVALAPGRWRDFPDGSFGGGTHPDRSLGGSQHMQTLRLAPTPIRVRFVRILMSASSHTAAPGTGTAAPGSPAATPGVHDVRDRIGYAIRELYLGTLGPRARRVGGNHAAAAFHDLLVHSPDKHQTKIYTSSTDPWHRVSDLNRAYEQPSFQTVLHSGLTRRQPLLVPIPLLYGTPQGAVAELRYLRALHIPLRGVELGEEPDGQLVSPEDYGALYLEFARLIKRSFPHLPLGGPAFATSLPDWAYWPDAHGDRSWTHRFVEYLHHHRALSLLDFFSFEWYPFDDVCSSPSTQLTRAARLLRDTLSLQHREGIPRKLPVYVTEYGYSSYAGEDEVDMVGALFDADTVGTLLSDGVRAAYLYGYEPNLPIRESLRCDTWGNLMLLHQTESGAPPQPVAAFWETRMLTHDWMLPGDTPHTLYRVRWEHPIPLVHPYALLPPDGKLSLLLVNLSPTHPYRLSIRIRGARLRAHIAGAHLNARGAAIRTRPHLEGPLEEWVLSSADYRWHPDGPQGIPSLDDPPPHRLLHPTPRGVLLEPYSVTVLRSALG